METKRLLGRILYLSNITNCESYESIIENMNEIHDLIKDYEPETDENRDEL